MASNSNRLSPRQKMINLMYIVLTAMLALNVSSDVLDGFSEVEKGVRRSNDIARMQNRRSLDVFQNVAVEDPEKAMEAYEQAVKVADTADSLCALIDRYKLMIVKEADGPDGQIEDIQAPEDMEAASVVMLNAMTNNGANLRKEVDAYREMLVKALGNDSIKIDAIEKILSTKVEGSIGGSSWETSKFDNKPVVAAVTLLSQLQNDVRAAEGETIRTLMTAIDKGLEKKLEDNMTIAPISDVRVNEISAFVIPKSQVVMKGTPFEADVVMAAVHNENYPTITINGRTLPHGTTKYTETASSVGTHNYSGNIALTMPDGSKKSFPFQGSYTVIEPMATVSADMMNVLYAGIDNPISISVGGIPAQNVSASISGGSLTRKGNGWVARPSSPGKDVEVTVTAELDGKTMQIGKHTFKVRRLPDPTPFISYTDGSGNRQEYKGGKPFAKHLLTSASGIQAAIDDGLLNIPFRVNGFEMVFFDSMGNALVETSDGANFSQRQKEAMRRLNRGKRFFISRVRATGPDGVTRDLSPIEVLVN